MLSGLQSARKDSRPADVAVLEAQLQQMLRETGSGAPSSTPPPRPPPSMATPGSYLIHHRRLKITRVQFDSLIQDDSEEEKLMLPALHRRGGYVSQSAVALHCWMMPPPCVKNSYMNTDPCIDDVVHEFSPSIGGNGLSRYMTDFHEIEDRWVLVCTMQRNGASNNCMMTRKGGKSEGSPGYGSLRRLNSSSFSIAFVRKVVTNAACISRSLPSRPQPPIKRLVIT